MVPGSVFADGVETSLGRGADQFSGPSSGAGVVLCDDVGDCRGSGTGDCGWGAPPGEGGEHAFGGDTPPETLFKVGALLCH